MFTIATALLIGHASTFIFSLIAVLASLYIFKIAGDDKEPVMTKRDRLITRFFCLVALAMAGFGIYSSFVGFAALLT